jgi:peptidase M48-like protein
VAESGASASPGLPSGPQPRPRPNLLSYPSPTTSRYLVFVTALLASGLFVGNWFHTQTRGEEWLSVVTECAAGMLDTGTDLAESLARHRQYLACTAEVERDRTLFAVGGTLVAAGAAGVVLLLAPAVVRRRRRLRKPGEPLAGAVDRFRELAAGAGVGGRVRPLLGPATQRDAFTFGLPGRYLVALPPAVAVRWRDPTLFDPVVSHELAHVRHRDVALAWLARSVWVALLPILLLPVLVGVLSGDTSLFVDYLWRAVLLAVVVALLSASLLRSREYVADLRAVQGTARLAAMARVVGATRPGRAAPWRRLLANHPEPADRVAALHEPGRVARVGFLDGLTSAFLAALSVPLLVSGLWSGLAATGRGGLAYLFACALLGPTMGASIGLGLWRAALVARVTGERVPAGFVAAGVAAGFLLGHAASLGQVGAASITGTLNSVWLLVFAVIGGGATLVSAGLGAVWAEAAPRQRRASSAWLVAVLANSVVFTAVLWAGSQLQSLADTGGWVIARSALAGPLATWWMAGAVVLLALMAVLPLVLRPRAAPAPAWLVDQPPAAPWPPAAPPRLGAALLAAVAAGAAAAATIVGYRIAAGASQSDAETFERFLAYQWVLAGGAAAGSLVLAVLRPRHGPALATAGLPVAVAVGSAGFLALNVAIGGSLDAEFVGSLVRPVVVIGFAVLIAALPAAYALSRLIRRGAGPGGLWLVGATVALSLVVAAGALEQRHALIGPNPFATGSVLEEVPVLDQADDPAVAAELGGYLTDVVPAITSTYGALVQLGITLEGDPTLDHPTRAALLRSQVLVPVEQLRGDLGALTFVSPEVRAVHDLALVALDTAVLKYRTLADAYAAQDPALLAQARTLEREESRRWLQWQQARSDLAGTLTLP